jgi:hypothetical protein
LRGGACPGAWFALLCGFTRELASQNGLICPLNFIVLKVYRLYRMAAFTKRLYLGHIGEFEKTCL